MDLRTFLLLCLGVLGVSSFEASAASQEDSNDCRTSTGDFCTRTGSCSIQGADWYQTVTVDKNDIFDTQGWPGLCDMVHVALVQGNCSPPQSQVNVTAFLSATTFANIPSIVGPLACEAEITVIADGDVAPLGAPDGILNAADLLVMQQIVLGMISPDATTLAHGDVYPEGAPDGAITLSDLLVHLQLIFSQ